jgi:hypothetical protein
MLTTIHVTVMPANVKRPLRVYSADTFGVVMKGKCVPVTPTSPTSVTIAKGAPKSKLACRNAKLADLGIAAKPLPAFIKARKAGKTQAPEIVGAPLVKLTPELVAQLIAMLNSSHA